LGSIILLLLSLDACYSPVLRERLAQR
jgi:hypothetical protein